MFAQPGNPEPYNLSNGNYYFSSWSPNEPSGSYPPNMIFIKSSTQDPQLSTEMTSNYIAAYNLTTQTRINGLDSLGFSFINTGTNGYLGAAVLALKASGRADIQVQWTGRTISPNSRIYKIVLQYRIGSSGSFISLASEYQRNDTAGNYIQLPPIPLPEEVNNQPVVQLRWKYYYVSGTGTRPQLAVDDITVTSETGNFSNLPPLLLNPANQASGVPASPVFKWNSLLQAVNYELRIATDSLFNDNLTIYPNIIDTTYTVNSLNYLTTYFWKLRGVNGTNQSPWSVVWKFTTAPLISAPVLLAPLDSAINQPTTLSFDWMDSPGANFYRMQVATSSGFGSLIIDKDSLTSSSFQTAIGILDYSTHYFWRVRAAIDSLNYSQWSATRYFTTIVPPFTNPPSFDLSIGNYAMNEWQSNKPPETYPQSMVFQRCNIVDPQLADATVTNYTGYYNLTSGTRLNGLGGNGFSFINTTTNGNLGAALLSLNTTGRNSIKVYWTGRTIQPNSKIYRIALQYRTDTTSSFINLGSEYERNTTAGHFTNFGPVNLPLAANNKPIIQLRWKYYFVSGSGTRPELAVDDIIVQSQPSQQIALNQGWNTISSYMIPNDPSLETMLSGISSKIKIVRDDSGMVYKPAEGINTIVNWDSTDGYQVNLTSPANLIIDGSIIQPSNLPIHLYQGWNLIAYSRNTEMPVLTAFSGIMDHLLLVKGPVGEIFFPFWDINTIGNLKPGLGYYVYVTDACVLVYPD
jgi:hypothetical protein